jgi:hydroxymethylpyrimidine kinase/phosphomethylpyrimidine kinase
VTPNTKEATVLTGIEIETVADMHAAAAKLVDAGAKACLVKGGHLRSAAAIDVLMVGKSAREFVTERLPTKHTHGTGCQLSAAIAAFLAQGLDLIEAVGRGKVFITRAIQGGLAIGDGTGPANPLAWKR